MNKEEIKELLKKAKIRDKKQELLDKPIEECPDITIKEAVELGFSYEEIIFG